MLLAGIAAPAGVRNPPETSAHGTADNPPAPCPQHGHRPAVAVREETSDTVGSAETRRLPSWDATREDRASPCVEPADRESDLAAGGALAPPARGECRPAGAGGAAMPRVSVPAAATFVSRHPSGTQMRADSPAVGHTPRRGALSPGCGLGLRGRVAGCVSLPSSAAGDPEHRGGTEGQAPPLSAL